MAKQSGLLPEFRRQRFYCPDCSGELKMITRFNKGKLQPLCVCSKCKREERKPKNFKAETKIKILEPRFIT